MVKTLDGMMGTAHEEVRVADERRVRAGERALMGEPRLPLLAACSVLQGWFEESHLERMSAEGFDDVRRAHNAVFANLPAEGMRLTALADHAGISKQAMGELVDDLERKGYVERRPDPHDGRAKLVCWARRGEDAHQVTLRIFRSLEDELADAVGRDELEALRDTLASLVGHVMGGGGDRP